MCFIFSTSFPGLLLSFLYEFDVEREEALGTRLVKSITCPEGIVDLDRYGIDPEVINNSESDNGVELNDIVIGDVAKIIFYKNLMWN